MIPVIMGLMLLVSTLVPDFVVQVAAVFLLGIGVGRLLTKKFRHRLR